MKVMLLKKLWHILFPCLILFFHLQSLHAQICVDDYFFINFNTATVQNPVATISTIQNEIITAGNAQRYNSLLQGGWLTKFSAQGTILWSKLYYTSLLNFLNFTSIVPADNDNYLITGNIGDIDSGSWKSDCLCFTVHFSEYALLMKVDKYGNVIWSRILSNLIRPFASSDITSVETTIDGDFILSLNYFTTTDYRLIMRIDPDGNVKWTTLISSTSRNASYGNAKLKILDNGNIVFTNYASVLDNDYPYQRRGYYFGCLNVTTGERIWSHLFLGRDTLSYRQNVFGEVVNISELPNRDLSFITSYADAPVNSYFRKTDHVLNFIADSSGILKKVISYTSSVSPFYASSVAENGIGDRVILMDDGDSPYMMNTNFNGDILWQKGYAAIGRGQATKCVLSTDYGFYFFSFTNNGGSKDPKLVKTDMSGNAPCVESQFTVTAKDVVSSYFMQNLNLIYEKSAAKWSDVPLGIYNYFIKGNNVCRIACCSDVTDTANAVNLCNVGAYTLPNNDIVKTSGTYTITYKTTKGCDSIVYYNINFSFTPKVSLGADTCFGGKDSVVLKTQSGYINYVWNGITTNSPIYVVKQPGTYSVTVSNMCGIKTDTVQVLKSCEFEIYMPNAFTPNGDGLNDWFRVPKQNYNRLISFTIFNRWGQKVFATQNISEGWNGMNGEYQASIGTYVYIIVMKSLDGRKTFTEKGYVTLIR